MPHDKKSAAELRAELRSMRKETLKPVSKMRMGDISAEIEKLKTAREDTPAAAATPSAPVKAMKSAVSSIKAAKAAEFPVVPASEVSKGKAVSKKSSAPASAGGEKKKTTKMDRLMKMLEEMSDSE